MAPRNFADHVTLKPPYTQLPFPQLPIDQLSTSMATKTSCSSATTSASQSGSTSATPKLHYWGFMTSSTAGSSCTSTARTALPSNIMETFEPLYHHRSHLFIDAMVFDIDHKIHQHWVHYIQQHGVDSDRCILMNDIEDHQHLGGEAE